MQSSIVTKIRMSSISEMYIFSVQKEKGTSQDLLLEEFLDVKYTTLRCYSIVKYSVLAGSDVLTRFAKFLGLF